MTIECPHCGETTDVAQYLFRMSPESALAELLLAQFARLYREQLGAPYPLRGEEDVEALRLLLQTQQDAKEQICGADIAGISELWCSYLSEAGGRAGVEQFVYSWLPEREGPSQVIPFRRRT